MGRSGGAFASCGGGESPTKARDPTLPLPTPMTTPVVSDMARNITVKLTKIPSYIGHF
jgi:hypothetical protein